MIFRLDSEVLKNGVLPETFHVVLSSSLSDTYSMAFFFLGSCSTHPIIDLSVSYRIMNAIS